MVTPRWERKAPSATAASEGTGGTTFSTAASSPSTAYTAAGTTYRTTLQEIDRLIRDAGYQPMRRRQDYSVIEEPVAA